MAIANLQETLLFYTMRKAHLNQEIIELQSQKTLAVAETSDTNALYAANKADIRDYFKYLYENDEELQEAYSAYTEIPDFEESIDEVTAQVQAQLDELAVWENQIDTQMKTKNTELQEIETYYDSVKQMEQSNIQEDFRFGLDS